MPASFKAIVRHVSVFKVFQHYMASKQLWFCAKITSLYVYLAQ